MIVWLLSLALAFSAINDDLPPVKFQGNAVPAVVITVDDTNQPNTCGVAPKGFTTQGCEYTTDKGVPVITVSNPCKYPEAKDKASFAHLMCHEFGHANGWNRTHDN